MKKLNESVQVPCIQRTKWRADSTSCLAPFVISLSTSVKDGEIRSSFPFKETRILKSGGPVLHCSKPMKAAIEPMIICVIAL